MGFTSDFGIGFAARTAGLALSAILLTAANTPSATLDVAITGLRSTKGNVLICVTANAKYFPNCSKDPLAHKRSVAAANAAMVQFNDMTPGTYAVGLIHDENANKKLDVAIMIPREGFGFSRNPVITFGPPKFKAAAFSVGAGESLQGVKMKYML
jgi:uncharacterized protein (DUF2141 family)